MKELDKEAIATRKMLERVPSDKFAWKPHEKSMSLLQLATHVAEIPGWLQSILHSEGMDFANLDYQPVTIDSIEALMNYLDDSLIKGKAALQTASDTQLNDCWTMRTGDQIHLKEAKGEMVRHAFCQIVHHRAQLSVYLRLLNIPVPGCYGPTADEPSF